MLLVICNEKHHFVITASPDFDDLVYRCRHCGVIAKNVGQSMSNAPKCIKD